MRQRLVEARGGGPVAVGFLAGVARCLELDGDQIRARVKDLLCPVLGLSI